MVSSERGGSANDSELLIILIFRSTAASFTPWREGLDSFCALGYFGHEMHFSHDENMCLLYVGHR